MTSPQESWRRGNNERHTIYVMLRPPETEHSFEKHTRSLNRVAPQPNSALRFRLFRGGTLADRSGMSNSLTFSPTYETHTPPRTIRVQQHLRPLHFLRSSLQLLDHVPTDYAFFIRQSGFVLLTHEHLLVLPNSPVIRQPLNLDSEIGGDTRGPQELLGICVHSRTPPHSVLVFSLVMTQRGSTVECFRKTE